MSKRIIRPPRWPDKNNWPASRFARRVYLFLKRKRLNTLLDLGCGGGRDAVYFARKGFKVVATDLVETAEQQEKLRKNGVGWISGDLQSIRLANNSFDVIYAHLSLHYFDDKTTASIFRKIRGILKPGGYFFVKCKSADDPLFGRGRMIEENYYDFGMTRHFFTKEYMAEKLKDFRVIKIQRTNSFVHPARASFVEAFAQKL